MIPALQPRTRKHNQRSDASGTEMVTGRRGWNAHAMWWWSRTTGGLLRKGCTGRRTVGGDSACVS